jgi:hypothetical protein
VPVWNARSRLARRPGRARIGREAELRRRQRIRHAPDNEDVRGDSTEARPRVGRRRSRWSTGAASSIDMTSKRSAQSDTLEPVTPDSWFGLTSSTLAGQSDHVSVGIDHRALCPLASRAGAAGVSQGNVLRTSSRGFAGSPSGEEQGLSVPVARTCFAVAARVPCSLFWASLRAVAEPKPHSAAVTIAEALVRSIRAPRRLILEAGGYAAVGGPNQVVSASGSPRWVRSPTQATYPSGRINTAVGTVTAPSTGTSHSPS